MKKIPLPNYKTEKGSTFASREEFLESSVVVDASEGKLDYSGVPLTQVDFKLSDMAEKRMTTQVAVSKDELHCFVIGDSGSGKTRRVVEPTISLLCKARQSMVISDPKGELYRLTAKALEKNNYKVYVLNFRNPSHSNRWNPLELIENLYKLGDRENRDKATLLLKDMADILKSESHSQGDVFWENSAAKFFIGIAQMILETMDSGYLTFENIVLLGQYIEDILLRALNDEKEALLIKSKIMKCFPPGTPVANNFSQVLNAAPNTLRSIVAVYDNMVSLYSNQEGLLDLFSKSEIKIDSLGEEPSALFFILPDDSEALYPIATAFIKQIYSTLVNKADSSFETNGLLPVKVNFLLDEFANFVKIPSVGSMLTAARSRGIRFVLICQSMEQLYDKYGEADAETLMSNCRVWIYLGSRDYEFLDRLVQMSGKHISEYTRECDQLISLDMLQHLNPGEVLIFNDRCSPFFGYLSDFDDYDFGKNFVTEISVPEENESFLKQNRCICDLSQILDRAENLNYNPETDFEDDVEWIEDDYDEKMRNDVEEFVKTNKKSDD